MRKPKGDWTDLFLAFRIALDPRKLWLAFKGVVLSMVLVALVVIAFACAHVAIGIPMAPLPAEGFDGVLLPGAADVGPQGMVAAGQGEAYGDILDALAGGRVGAVVRAARQFSRQLVFRAAREVCAVLGARGSGVFACLVRLWSCQALATLAALGALVALVLLFVWSYYGAAIMRLASVDYGLGERLELRSVVAYVRRKHQSFYCPALGLVIAAACVEASLAIAGLVVWNLLFVLATVVGLLGLGVVLSVVRDHTRSAARSLAVGVAGAVVLAVVLAVIASLNLRVPYVGEVLVGIMSPLALVGGAIAVILTLWLFLGLPLMFGTVATSDVGTFDAWSRSFHYLFVHPWRYAFYCLAAVAHGGACLLFVCLVRLGAEWAAWAPLAAGSLLAGGDAAPGVLSAVLLANKVVLDLVVLAFAAAYCFSAAAIIYLLLRLRADGTPISELHLEPRDRERLAPPPAEPAG